MDYCVEAAVALCQSIGPNYGPHVLIGLANLLGLFALYMKSRKTAKTTDEIKAEVAATKSEVAETRAMVSVRPPPLAMPSGVPSAAPVTIHTGDEREP